MMSTTILVENSTRDALAATRDLYGAGSMDAVIRRVMRDATPSAAQIWQAHGARARRVLARYGAIRLVAFGSRTRDDRTPASDLDLVVEMPSESGVTGLLGLRDELSALLGTNIDLGDMPARDSRLWKRLKAEGIVLVGKPL